VAERGIVCLNGNPDWGLILGAISAVFTFLLFLTQYYSRVYIPRRKDKEEKRNLIYKPLLMDVDSLIERVSKREVFGPPFNWKTVEGKVCAQLYRRLEELFQEKTNNYHRLLKHNQEFIRFRSYFYLYNNLSDFEKEFRSLGVGLLEYDLYNTILDPILEGRKVSLELIEENNPKLYEHLVKCPSYKKLKDLFDQFSEEDPCLIPLRNIEKDLLEQAEKLKVRLKDF
jgi:hypothetical protein